MPLAPGIRLGPYEVLSPLGAGGMGEVWRARDTRLGRDVAVKVLPDDLAGNPKALARFESESRAVAALSHPNILALHDVGESEGVRYAVTELLEGETLRALVTRGAVPLKRALEVARQLADGLAAAHDKGIVHRDLKPENVFLTSDGRAKVLDFGLAAIRGVAAGLGSDTRSPTAPVLTETGAVVGTVAYMSPEQARGEAVDFRTDQFSLGIVLYEMLTGRRPFKGVSAVDLLAAIVRDEPEPLEKAAPRLPAPVCWLVERCLAKDPGERYDSTRDLARELATLRVHLSRTATGPATEADGAATPRDGIPSRARRRRLAFAALALWALAASAAAIRWARKEPAAPVPAYRRVTFRRGNIQTARFAPDGETIVYSAVLEGKAAEVFTTRADNPVSRPVGLAGTQLLALSRSAELLVASARTNTPWKTFGTLARVPIEGGAQRALLEDVREADWAPDGGTIAVVRRVEGETRLEYPVGTVLDRGEISGPRVSPDGTRVVYVRYEGDRAALVVVDRSGRKNVVPTPFQSPFGPVWHPDGRQIWFTADEPGRTQAAPLCAVDESGAFRLLSRVPKDQILHDVARDGRLLVEHQLPWATTVGQAPGETKERDLGWLDHSIVTGISSDGRTIAFWEGGDGERWKPAVYVRGTDGSPAVRLGDGTSGELSPDGRWVLARSEGRFSLLPTGPGEPRPVDGKGVELLGFARFFPDGKRLLVAGREPGKERWLFVLPLDGGALRAVAPVTAPGPVAAAVSPDGRSFAARGRDERISLYPVEGGEPAPVPGAEPGEAPYVFSPDGRFLYVGPPVGRAPPLRVVKLDVRSGRREPWKEIAPVGSPGAISLQSLVITPDARAYAYGYRGQLFCDLYVVEGLR